jgi:hypothetical protein
VYPASARILADLEIRPIAKSVGQHHHTDLTQQQTRWGVTVTVFLML